MKHSQKIKRVFIEDDPSVNILLEKYKLLRNEATSNSANNNRQVTYIQVYGIFLFTITGIFFGFNDKISLNNIPDFFRLPVLILAAALLFYYYSQIYLSSFTFRILRLRMAEIERTLNKISGKNILYYERIIAPNFFGRISLNGRYLLPNAWLQFFTFILFSVAVYVLSILSIKLLSSQPGWIIFFIGNLAFFAFTLVWENFRLSLPGSISLKDKKTETSNGFVTALKLSRYILNYFVVIVITYAALFNKFGDPFSTFTTGILAQFFASLSTFSESMILLWTVVYTALCGLFLPTPSELPLALIGTIGTLKIFVAAALGKAIGSVILYIVSGIYFKINHHNSGRWRQYLETGPTSRFFVKGRVSIFYIVAQSIPFAPMRSATVAYSAVTPISLRGATVVCLGSFLGTISRMLLIGAMVATGLWALPYVVVSP